MIDTPIIACIPYYNCQDYIRRSVISLLSQTHKKLTLVVINDGDFVTPPWPALADIDDPRLVRFETSENRGPYFAIQVLLESTNAPYLLIQDADDWSEPEWAAVLLSTALNDDADFVVTSQSERDDNDAETGTRWTTAPCCKNKFFFQPTITAEFTNRSAHQGLFKTRALKQMGGYYGGFKINYDVFITNLILMTGRVSHINTRLYNYFLRKDSLSRGEKFGYRSEERKNVKNKLASMYEIAYKQYSKHLQGDINANSLFSSLAALCRKNVTVDELSALHYESLCLSKLL